eukprot:scaffold72805_cov63-Phaeocystis_antarctica.AAC.1
MLSAQLKNNAQHVHVALFISPPVTRRCLQHVWLFREEIKTSVVMLFVCFSSGVCADEKLSVAVIKQEEQEIAATLMREQIAELKGEMKQKDEAIAALTDARKAKAEHTHVQLTARGEVLEVVSSAYVKALVERMEASEEKNAAQDAEVGTMRAELKSGKATLAVQEARVGELSATVAQFLATSGTRPKPVDAAETTAARRLSE